MGVAADSGGGVGMGVWVCKGAAVGNAEVVGATESSVSSLAQEASRQRVLRVIRKPVRLLIRLMFGWLKVAGWHDRVGLGSQEEPEDRVTWE